MTSKYGSLRVWWAFHGERLGLVLCVILAVALSALSVPFMLDMEPATTVYGKVTGFRARQSDTDAGLYAQVLLGTRPVVVTLRPDHGCQVGGRIALLERRTMRFYRYKAAIRPCR